MLVAWVRSLFLGNLWGTFTSLKAGSVDVFGGHTRSKLYDQPIP